MLGVMIVPTGIGAEIGGHSGDATSAAHLLAEVCDDLIIHPNVVNASDFTEQPANSLYVEGSLLDHFLDGGTRLKRCKRQNHILVAGNSEDRDMLNCVNAMRSLLGISAEVTVLRTPLMMNGYIDEGRRKASGDIHGLDELIAQVDEYEYDALAIHTPIMVPTEVAENYVRNGGINPWGGVEALLSKQVYYATGKPTAHAPVEAHADYDFGVTDPRLAPEMLCAAHLGCVLRGLHKAPTPTIERGSNTIGWEDVDVLVSPACWGAPHKICQEKGIPMIFVTENRTTEVREYERNVLGSVRTNVPAFGVRTYMEAVGAIVSLKMGRSFESHMRPIMSVKVS